jgi:hypothetical protein
MAKIRRNNVDYFIKQSNGKVRHAKECLNCKEPFLASRITAKYCSNTCKQANYIYRQQNNVFNDDNMRLKL